MLFDLRSRGRRSTVRVIYLFLAIVMVVGLVGLGIGTGSTGGLLNAGGNGSGSGGSSISNQQVRSALKATKKNPNSAGAWASLVSAYWSAAGTGSNFNTASNTYTASGKKQLQYGANAWRQYLKVSGGKPSTQTSFLAAGIYQNLQQWANEAEAWNYAAQIAPGSTQSLKPYICLALSAYAAKQNTKGDLAAAEAVRLSPKLQRLTLKSTLQTAKTSATTAQSTLVAEC